MQKITSTTQNNEETKMSVRQLIQQWENFSRQHESEKKIAQEREKKMQVEMEKMKAENLRLSKNFGAYVPHETLRIMMTQLVQQISEAAQSPSPEEVSELTRREINEF